MPGEPEGIFLEPRMLEFSLQPKHIAKKSIAERLRCGEDGGVGVGQSEYRTRNIVKGVRVGENNKPFFLFQFVEGTKIHAKMIHIFKIGLYNQSLSKGQHYQRPDS